MTNIDITGPGWIYNLSDYCQMFDLSTDDLKKSIFDFPGGIASFNAEMHNLGHLVVSGDPAYQLQPHDMNEHAQAVCTDNEQFLRSHIHTLQSQEASYLSTIFTSWQKNLRQFLDDYPIGITDQRYYPSTSLPFPFKTHQFNLALCSDFLFHTHQTHKFVMSQLLPELCRIATEVRIFPLLDQEGNISSELGPVMLDLQHNNFGVEVREVPYEIRAGSNAMLRIWANECLVTPEGN